MGGRSDRCGALQPRQKRDSWKIAVDGDKLGGTNVGQGPGLLGSVVAQPWSSRVIPLCNPYSSQSRGPPGAQWTQWGLPTAKVPEYGSVHVYSLTEASVSNSQRSASV